MIPVRLELYNFLAYRDPAPLDFTGIHLACLAGPNGAGKSSLLDAITWALWGKARGTADELIHKGQSEMRVIFDFALDNNTYRVIRRREKSGKTGKTALDFQVRDGDRWVALNEQSVRQTEAKIERALRMNYDTFINSAFLLQGRADEFTVKAAAERKRVLSDILGLEMWAEYEERAKARISDLRTQVAAMDFQIASIQRELGEEEARKAALTQAQQSLIEATAAREALAQQVQALTEAEINLANKRSQRDDLQRRTDKGRQELQAIDDDVAGLTPELEAARRLAAESADIEAGFAEWTEARAQVEAQTTAMSESLRNAITQLREESAALQARNDALKAEMEDLRKSLDLIEGGDEPTCPLCGQPLDQAHRAQLAAQFEQAGKEKGDAWRNNKARIDDVARQVKVYENAANALATEDPFARFPALADVLGGLGHDPAAFQDLRARVVGLAVFEARHADLQAAQEKLPRLEASAAQLAQRRARWEQDLAGDLAALSALAAEIAALEAQVSGAAALRRRYAELEAQEHRAREAAVRAKQLVDVLEQQRRQLETLTAQSDRARAEQAIYEELRVAFGKNGVPAMIIEAAIPEIEDAANELLRRLTGGQIHLRFEMQREKKSGEGAIETLDLIINDALGDRPYEMYSGGEQFRVNFAVRIALSRLLARRAGAQLRTLVIDEGFGSQDTEGRQRLVEAIVAIQDDFDKIIVVTHIDELKDAFPARIEVTKTDRGSQIALM